ncbi:MAG: hypothetical protein IT385_09535 [Deltaproteobacteria bacterium]|nr:hypothetical protein [Deltaproteobacteria bacterium]
MTMLEPPRPGSVTGSSVWLRGSPATGAGSERIATFPRGTGVELASEVKSTDKAYPDWYGVAVAGKQGFMARQFVKMAQAPPPGAAAALQPEGPAQADATGPKPDAAKLNATKPDAGSGGSLFFSGHLLRMREEGEFKQTPKKSKPLDNVLFRACLWAMQGLGVPAKEQAERAKKLQSSACNLQSFFLLDNASEIRRQNATLDYGGFKKWLEGAMGPYFLKQFTTTWQWGGSKKRSDETDGTMNDNSGVLKDDGCSPFDSPYKKAQALLGAEGRLIRITVDRDSGWHFFAGEVRDGVLHAFDNQGDGAGRSGAFDLREIKPDTKGGRVYEHLSNNKKFRKFNVGMSDEEKQQEKDEKERKAKLAAERKAKKKKKS